MQHFNDDQFPPRAQQPLKHGIALAELWGVLPAGHQQQILQALSRIVVQCLATPRTVEEVSHEWD